MQTHINVLLNMQLKRTRATLVSACVCTFVGIMLCVYLCANHVRSGLACMLLRSPAYAACVDNALLCAPFSCMNESLGCPELFATILSVSAVVIWAATRACLSNLLHITALHRAITRAPVYVCGLSKCERGGVEVSNVSRHLGVASSTTNSTSRPCTQRKTRHT